MIRWIIKRYKRWMMMRDWNALPLKYQRAFRALGMEPRDDRCLPAIEREKALQRETCEQEENLRTGTMTHKTAQQIAKQRGWHGLFDEKGEGE